MKLVLKSAAVVVTDISYCILWCHALCMTFWNHLCFGKFGKRAPNFISEGGGLGWPWSGSDQHVQ